MNSRNALCFSHKKAYGFTLVEVLVVLSITAIIVGVATPSFMNIIANNRVAAASSELLITLNLGKSEAIRSRQTTLLCKSPNGTQCDNGASWAGGLLLFQDDDNSGDVSNDERIIKVIPASEPSLNFAHTGSSPNNIRFNGKGHTNSNGHFCIYNSYKQENSRAVVFTQSGRIHAEKRPYDC